MKTRLITILTLACLCGCATPAQRATRERMANIIIPEIEFRQANIMDIIHFLQDQSVENDPDLEKEKTGVGIILSLDTPAEPPEPSIDPFGADARVSHYPPITFKARSISLLDALDTVCREAGIRYRIDRNGILSFEPKERVQQENP